MITLYNESCFLSKAGEAFIKLQLIIMLTTIAGKNIDISVEQSL